MITEQTYPTYASILSATEFTISGAFQPPHLCFIESLFVIVWKILFSSSFGQFIVYDAPHAFLLYKVPTYFDFKLSMFKNIQSNYSN